MINYNKLYDENNYNYNYYMTIFIEDIFFLMEKKQKSIEMKKYNKTKLIFIKKGNNILSSSSF